MRSAVICEPVRTPIGRYGGMFSSLTAVDLGVAALRGLLERTAIPPDAVDDVILGHCYPNSEAPAIGRVVTAPEVRRTGAGRALMRSAIDQVKRLYPGQPIRLGAQRYLEKFYGSLGFGPVGEPYDEDGIAHIEMVRPS